MRFGEHSDQKTAAQPAACHQPRSGERCAMREGAKDLENKQSETRIHASRESTTPVLQRPLPAHRR